MSQIIEKEPVFSAASAQILDQFDASLRKRILNVLENRMREEKRSEIKGDDVWAAIKIVLEQLRSEMANPA